MKPQLKLHDLDGMSVAMLAAASGNAANLRDVLENVIELEVSLSQSYLQAKRDMIHIPPSTHFSHPAAATVGLSHRAACNLTDQAT